MDGSGTAEKNQSSKQRLKKR